MREALAPTPPLSPADLKHLRDLCAEIGPLHYVAPDAVCSLDDEGVSAALGFFVSTHAPLFVEAYNALPRLLDALAAKDEEIARLKEGV